MNFSYFTNNPNSLLQRSDNITTHLEQLMTVSGNKVQVKSHTVTMLVRLIGYMNKLYFHIDKISASDTTMLLVPIYKSTQVTGTCTTLQNNTYHNEKS